MSRQQRSKVLGVGLWLMGCLCFAASTAFAQSVHWQQSEEINAGQLGTLELVFEDLEPAGEVTLPEVKDLEFIGSPSHSSSTTIINFKRSSAVTFGYNVRPKRKGTIVIPAFSVQTNKGSMEVPSVEVVVGEAVLPGAAGGQAVRMEDAVVARLSTSSREPYAGEVIDLEFVLAVTAGRRAELAGNISWEPEDLIHEEWSGPEQLNSASTRGVRFRSRMLAPDPGKLVLSPVNQEVRIETGRMMRRGFFSEPEVIAFEATSPPVELNVRPLPKPPPGFSGAVGQFSLTSKLIPESTSVGEPITWTLTLEGKGNWPSGVALPGRVIPNSIRTLAPKTSRSFAQGKLFEGSISEDLVLIPLQAGELVLEPVHFIYFDPKKNQYETLTVEPPKLEIEQAKASAVPTLPTPGPIQEAKPPPGPEQSGPEIVQPAGVPPTPEAAPESRPLTEPQLPREPKPGDSVSLAPIGSMGVSVGVVAPFGLLLALWLGLAFRQGLQTDPNRPRRHAREELREVVVAIRNPRDQEALRAALLKWQRCARTLLGVGHAAPTATLLRKGASSESPSFFEPSDTDEGWARCWQEAEVVLYAKQGGLPADWAARADALAQAKRIPGFNPLRALLWRNLLPIFAVIWVVTFGTSGLAQSTSPNDSSALGSGIDAYQQGAFGQAEARFRERLAAEPRDWNAHANLGLALLQQQKRAAALAELTSAFLGHPWDADLRWNLRLVAREMGVIDPTLGVVLFPSGWSAPFSELASWLSPALWQWVLVAGSLLVCAGLAGILVRRFRFAAAKPGAVEPQSRSVLGVRLCIGLGIACMLGGAFSLAEYGVLASPKVAMVVEESVVHSVPTEAETSQVQRRIPEGVLVAVQRKFLSWDCVRLPNGDVGWVRSEALVRLYPNR